MITLENVGYTADGNEILKNIDLEIGSEFLAVTGPNGGGKSTLAKIIMGIIKPTTGRVLWNGRDVTDQTVDERANLGISYAFQQPVKFKGLRVSDLLRIAAGKEASLSETCDILSEVGLCARDYIDRELDDSLSGGELKRIEIAMVLARKTALSVFDEPEAGIDLWSFEKLIHVFEELRAETDGGIFIISHQERILDIADKIAYLKNGRIERLAKRDEILPWILESAENGGSCSFLKNKIKGDVR